MGEASFSTNQCPGCARPLVAGPRPTMGIVRCADCGRNVVYVWSTFETLFADVSIGRTAVCDGVARLDALYWLAETARPEFRRALAFPEDIRVARFLVEPLTGQEGVVLGASHEEARYWVLVDGPEGTSVFEAERSTIMFVERSATSLKIHGQGGVVVKEEG